MKSNHTIKIKGSSTLTLGVLAALFLVVGCGKPSLTTQSPAEVEAENQRSEDWGTFYVRPAKMGNGQPWPEFEEAKSAYQMRMALDMMKIGLFGTGLMI